MGVLEMDSRPFPAPLPHGNPVPFPPPPDSRLRANMNNQSDYTGRHRVHFCQSFQIASIYVAYVRS